MQSGKGPAAAAEDRAGREAGRWGMYDSGWTLNLFGTAVGAGLLYLPVTAAAGGLWALVVLTLLIFPMTYLSHRAFARVVLSAEGPTESIAEALAEDFGRGIGLAITLAYFAAFFGSCLIYGVGVTTTIVQFLGHHLGVAGAPRWLVAGLVLAALTAVVLGGEKVMVKVASALVLPLIAILLALAVILIPYWRGDHFQVAPSPGQLILAVLVGIPILVFAMNFTPVISTFVASYRQYLGDRRAADVKTGRILRVTCLLLVAVVMFYTFSMALTLTPDEVSQALAENLSAMTLLSDDPTLGFVSWLAPVIALIAIATSYFGTFCGAAEGLVGLIEDLRPSAPADAEAARRRRKFWAAWAMVLVIWAGAVADLDIVELVGLAVAPLIALLLFILPAVAFYRVPRLQQYRGAGALFILASGLVVIFGFVAGLLD